MAILNLSGNGLFARAAPVAALTPLDTSPCVSHCFVPKGLIAGFSKSQNSQSVQSVTPHN